MIISQHGNTFVSNKILKQLKRVHKAQVTDLLLLFMTRCALRLLEAI